MRETGGTATCPATAGVAGVTETDGIALGAAVTGATFNSGSSSGVTFTESALVLLEGGGSLESITAIKRSVSDSNIVSNPD